MKKKLFIASFLFFLVAVINPRDFPLPNVPLIYPAFIGFVGLLGAGKIINGIKKTWFLLLLIIIQWVYLKALQGIQGLPLRLGEIPYLIESLLILSAAGSVASIKQDGVRTGIVALVSAVTVSAGCGVWIHFLGEPVISLYSFLQQTVKGTIIDAATRTYEGYAFNGRAGLTNSIFGFSYQNAVALSLIVTNFLDPKRPIIKNYPLIAIFFSVLFLEMIICGERATVGAVLIGLLFYLVWAGKRMINFKTIFSVVTVSILAVMLIQYSTGTKSGNLQHRGLNEGKLTTRLLVMPLAAMETVFYQPFGAGGISRHYEYMAKKRGYYKNGKPIAAHNHYANTVMYDGLMGIVIVSSLFLGFIKKIFLIRKMNDKGVQLILAAACVTALVHATTHNAGFFKLEPATLIVFGLLWGASSRPIKTS